MSIVELSSNELEELRAAHRSAKKKSDAYKINTVILLGTGWTLEEVSQALLFDEETIRSYGNKYKNGGIAKLLLTNYKGSISKLSDEQIEVLCEELNLNIYMATKDVCKYVENKFNIHYTVSGMTDLLKRIGYVYKKPKMKPGNPDNCAQEFFLKEYEKFMSERKSSDAVFYVDAVHPTHNSQPAYGWLKKGEDRELKTNSGRDRYNIHGALNADTYEVTTICTEDSINTSTTIDEWH